MATSSSTYWASVPTERIGDELASRAEQAKTNKLSSDIYARMRRAYRYYYGLDPSGIHTTSQVLRGGDEGELAEMRVNHSRSLVNTLLNLIVAPKIVWTPKAVNIDYDSVRECDLAAGILEYYWSERQVSRFAVGALEQGIVFTEGFVMLEWDETSGDQFAVDPDSDEPVKAGDVLLHAVQPWDVYRDVKKTSWDALDWLIVRRRVNKFDLVARFPDKAEQILAAPTDPDLWSANPGADALTQNDDVVAHYFFHKRTPAMPNGRETVFLPGGLVLRDTELSYAEVPVYRVSAGELTGTPFGYSPYLDILGVQELMDSLHTAVATNQSTLATQCIAVTEGTQISFDEVAGGMRVIYTPPGQPAGAGIAPLQLTRTPSEVFQHLGNLKKEQELLIGLNSVVRGEAQSGEMSGAALALLQSQALQQSSTLQANYLRLVECIGSGVLSIIQQRASIPRKIAIVGKASSSLVTDMEYSSDSLTRVKRVQVEIGNPLSQTAAGRAEMAKELIQMGFVKTVEQYQQVLSTGRLEPLTQSVSSQLLLIKSENEQMARGQQIQALVLDDHTLHVREHAVVLANPEARRNPTVVQSVLAHIDEHQKLYYAAPPQTLIMMGQHPPSMPPPGAPPPGGPGGPPPPGGPGGPHGGPGGPHGPPPAPPPGSEPGGPGTSQPRLPNVPVNPKTGMPWNGIDGGGMVPR